MKCTYFVYFFQLTSNRAPPPKNRRQPSHTGTQEGYIFRERSQSEKVYSYKTRLKDHQNYSGAPEGISHSENGLKAKVKKDRKAKSVEDLTRLTDTSDNRTLGSSLKPELLLNSESSSSPRRSKSTEPFENRFYSFDESSSPISPTRTDNSSSYLQQDDTKGQRRAMSEKLKKVCFPIAFWNVCMAERQFSKFFRKNYF